MNIPYFDRWINIDEGFTADINADSDEKNVNKDDTNSESDEIQIESPNKGNDITYIVNGKNVRIKKKTINKNDDGVIIDKEQPEEVNDKRLKKDVIDAVSAINNIQNQERAKEIYRLTGGDDTKIKDIIINFLDSPESKNRKIRRKYTDKNGNPIEYNLFHIINDLYNEGNFWETKGAYLYLDISGIQEDGYDIKNMYNTTVKTVGKGEYLLPLLYHDVYKQQVFGYNKYKNEKDEEEFSIGDNFILKDDTKPIENDNKYHLELKAPNASLSFNKEDKKKFIWIDKNYIKYNNNDDDIIDRYKSLIAASFIRYAAQQNKNRKNLYMCIFYVDNETPKGILFINISNIDISKDIPTYDEIKENKKISQVFTTFKNLINIVDGKSYNKSFQYEIGENYEINCKLNASFYKDNNIKESTILSRDNFVNEIYTK